MKPAARSYTCHRVVRPPAFDGELESGPGWRTLPWSEEFVDITGRPELRPRFRTRVKLGWDAACLYVGAELEEPHVQATVRRSNDVIFEDNDFEVFLDPDGDGLHYYELEVNAFGTLWELSLPRPYHAGGVPESGCNIAGLRCAVRVDGTLNDPRDEDRGWTVELAFPWEGLARFNLNRLDGRGGSTPPREGDVWRANFSRVQWRHRIRDGRYERIPPHGTPRPEGHPEEHEHPEDNWAWSPQGIVNMHLPDRWGRVVFGGEAP